MLRAPTRFLARFVLFSAGMAFVGGLSPTTAHAGGTCHSPTASAGKGVAVELSGACFQPTVLYVSPGQTITWTNRDDVEHTVTGLGFSWGSNGDLYRGDSVTYRFREVGVYPYSCIVHPGMVGAVIVGNPKVPSEASGALPPVPVASPAAQSAAPATQPEAERETGAGPWRVVALVAAGLFVVAALVLAVQQVQFRRSRAAAIG